jgi:hypothetical protein
MGGWRLKDGVMFGHALAAKLLWVFLMQESLWRKTLIAKIFLMLSWWIGFNKGIKLPQMLQHNGGI